MNKGKQKEKKEYHSSEESSHEGGLPADNLNEDHNTTCGECLLIGLSIFLMIITVPFSCCCCIKVVEEYRRAIIMRLGRIRGRARGPGMFCIIPCTDQFQTVDLRVQTYDIPPQDVLTADSVTIGVNAIVYYKISDPVKAIVNVEDASRATQLLGQTTLRSVIGMHDLADLIAQREKISKRLQQIMDKATDPWGVKVENVDIKDIKLPETLQRAMAAEAEANREAKAKVIAADGELQSAKELRLAAEEITLSPTALQLRYLQTLNTISDENNHTIVFPLPVSSDNNKQSTGITDQLMQLTGGLLKKKKEKLSDSETA